MQYFLSNNIVYAACGIISLRFDCAQQEWQRTEETEGRLITREQAMELTGGIDVESAMQDVYTNLQKLKQVGAQIASTKLVSRLSHIEKALAECRAFGKYASEMYKDEMADLELQRELLIGAMKNEK